MNTHGITFSETAYLSIAWRSLAGFHVGSKRMTTFAPTKLRPSPPALRVQKSNKPFKRCVQHKPFKRCEQHKPFKRCEQHKPFKQCVQHKPFKRCVQHKYIHTGLFRSKRLLPSNETSHNNSSFN